VASALMLAVGMLYMFAWIPVVHHRSYWATGDDLWGIFRGAHYVGWGFLGGIYTPSNGIVTFPGMPVILTPLALLSDHAHLTESYLPFIVQHPTAALILQPVELLLASTVAFACDALAQRLQVTRVRRAILCLVVAAIAWPTAAVWGHAEDALAMTFVVYAIVAMLDRKWSAFGWLLGLGIVVQPLVALLVPLFIGAAPRGQRLLLAFRSAALSAVLVGVALAGDASDTWRALFTQPTPPSMNHATPWVALAPKIVSGAAATSQHGEYLHQLGQAALIQANSRAIAEVSGGPGRLIDVLLAVVIGVYACRRAQDPVRLLWLAAVVLASRCLFEAVMTPYYLAPPLILAMVMASRRNGRTFLAATVIALEIMVFSYHHLNPWAWWLPVVIGLGAIVALGYPEDVGAPPGSVPEAHRERESPEPDSPQVEAMRVPEFT